MEREERCEACRWWEDADPEEILDRDDDLGWCRRHAPAPLVVIGCRDDGIASSEVVWPFTERTDFCGEWQARKPLPVVEPPA